MLIIDMPMPVKEWNCLDCKALCVDAFRHYCGITKKTIDTLKNMRARPDWCPIKGVLPDKGFSADNIPDEIVKKYEDYIVKARSAEKLAIEADLERRRREFEELVRCGECYYKDVHKRTFDEDRLWCRLHHMYVTADWFCADVVSSQGERKEK